MTTDINKLLERLRTYYGDDLACRMLLMDARHALEAMAGEVERLTSDVDALGDNLEKVVAERDRLKEALLDIKHFGAGFAQDRARKALGNAS